MDRLIKFHVFRVRQRLSPQIVSNSGLTLIELLMVTAIFCILAAIAVPAYDGYVERARISETIIQIESLASRIELFQRDNFRLPDTLAEIDQNMLQDAWGNSFIYVNFETLANDNANGGKRKDKNLVPVNDDFDLCSAGANGVTALPFTSAPGKDDIVRANNGSFIGLADDY